MQLGDNEPEVAMLTCNPSTRKVGETDIEVQGQLDIASLGQPGIHDTLPQSTKTRAGEMSQQIRAPAALQRTQD